MKYVVRGVMKIRPSMVVEADSPEEAIEKAWRGEHDLSDPRSCDNAESARMSDKKSWKAEAM